MPAYSVEFTTDRGLHRVQFTLDEDRALAPQVTQILEELNQRGHVIRGGREDILGAFWNGRDLDLTRTPQQLGLTPLRPVELRMRPKLKPPEPEPPPTPFWPKGATAGALAGATGGLVAWTLSTFATDLSLRLPTYDRLDLAVMGLLGAAVGAFILGSSALRRGGLVPAWIALGLLLGTVFGALGAAAALAVRAHLPFGASPRGFVGLRIVAWATAGGVLGFGLGGAWIRRGARCLADGLVAGLVAGALGGLVFCLPGPSDLWQAVGFAVLGTGLGIGLSAPALRRVTAVLELERRAGRPAGFLALREWGIDPGDNLALRGARGAPAARLMCDRGLCALAPEGEGVRVSGQPIAGPVHLRNGDSVELESTRYRFRRVRSAVP